MPNRKAVAFVSFQFLLAAIASAGVIGPSKRAAIVANILDSPSQLQQSQPEKPISKHDLSQIYRRALMPRNVEGTNGQSDEPSPEDNAEDTEEQVRESVPPGLTPLDQPGSRNLPMPPTSVESPLAVPNDLNGVELANGQYTPSEITNSEGEALRKTIYLMKFDVIFLYQDYVDRLDFSVYSPEEDIFYHCTGGLFTGNAIATPPSFSPCNKEYSEGVNDEDQGNISFAVESVRVPAPLTEAEPLVIYIKYDNEVENKSWTAPMTIDDSNVELFVQKKVAQQYHYQIKNRIAFRSPEVDRVSENN